MKVLAIVSGGMDSTVLAYYLNQLPDTKLIGIVSVDYGQRHKRELECASRTALKLGVPLYPLDLSAMRPYISASALTGDQPVPHGHYADDNMRATVVPNRNMILLSLAVGVAISNGADRVAYGAHAGDHDVYPDCRESFVDALSSAIALCDYTPPKLMAPFVTMSKADIVKLGLRIGVPFENTWTCYEGGETACGKCGTCVERLEAFAIAGAHDPIDYQNREYWKQVVASKQDLPTPVGHTAA
jgi:7-cyano-7-deazaguanine synthase